MSEVDIKEVVRGRYAEIARSVRAPGSSCCYDGEAGSRGISANLYADHETESLPEEAVLASLGCGNPTALAELGEGETVLDLGSGGGIDVLLSGRRVGPSGKAYGLDMTDGMLALARENQRKAGAKNVEFLKGEIEHIPLPDNSVDVIISNCVINLSADKDRVLREAFRVLKPGGRFAVSDVLTRGAIPEGVRRDVLLWVGCIAGALDENDYQIKLAVAGFEAIGIEPTRIHKVDDAREFLAGKGVDVDAIAPLVDGKFMSAFVRAKKPGQCAKGKVEACCASTCCEPEEETMIERQFNVLFLCTGNSARSILAESILKKDGAGRFRAFSAGSHPKGAVNPFALKVLESYGYPTDGYRSKSWDEFAAPGAPVMDFVFTVCDTAAAEVCPVWPGQPITAHWGIEDPAAIEGNAIQKEAAFVLAMRYLKNRISIFVNLPIRSLDRMSLNAKLREIGQLEGASRPRPEVA
jgi:arsenite methyltransferase